MSKSKHPLYKTWQGMKNRCYNKNAKNYADHGGRGIKVCDRWLGDFWNFVSDVVQRPAGSSLARINEDQDYTPDNCKWLTSDEKSRNRKSARTYTYNRKTKCLADWAKSSGMKYSTLVQRMDTWGCIKKALETPIRRGPAAERLEANGKYMTRNEWCAELDITRRTLERRFEAGKSTEEVFQPKQYEYQGEWKSLGEWCDELGLEYNDIRGKVIGNRLETAL